MGTKPSDRKVKVVVRNKKALHDFEILQKFEAGIVLSGSEVKSIRQGKCSIQDAYCIFEKKRGKSKRNNLESLELYVRNLHISPYQQSNDPKYNPTKERKLLLHKKELIRLKTAIEQGGLTLIPLSVYFSGPFVKLELALVKGKKKYDKREDIKKKDLQRELSKKVKL
ncbi:MAG: tmRNA-binding protein SmpB [Candidatus Kapaibacterium sp.]|nr:MAG: tmRNA-binding protein SmpB [Candidatus Kapabacteria bacterium]